MGSNWRPEANKDGDDYENPAEPPACFTDSATAVLTAQLRHPCTYYIAYFSNSVKPFFIGSTIDHVQTLKKRIK